ncbi:MAG: acyltransferase [Stigonema ocellatum SAG 48.90 = DSM 106950]|nr:acyltransferase [Stigonema ocellatum SAG 48.90 = DSM 106950]
MKFSKLEALRGFAAFYVVLHHTLPHSFFMSGFNLGTLFRFGQEAVIIFFLLSGFVMNFSYQKSSDKRFNVYFMKRFLRIYIPLVFILLLGYLIESAKSGFFVDPQLDVLIKNILMLQDVGALKPNVIVEPYMHNSPLWSLSYEWWFYMLFFPVVKHFRTHESQSTFIFIVSIISALIYTQEPNFISRLLMYFSIWWTGVYLSNLYLNTKEICFLSLIKPIITLGLISLILLINSYESLHSSTSQRLGVHPILELRHISFALLVLILSVLWNNYKWRGFDFIFKPFLLFAPISYVMYISHHYLISSATYFNRIGNTFIEYLLYFMCLLVFSSVIELKLYPLIRKQIMNIKLP